MKDLTKEFIPTNGKEKRLLDEHLSKQKASEESLSREKEIQISNDIEDADRNIYKGLDSHAVSELKGASVAPPSGGWPVFDKDGNVVKQ